MRYELWTAFIDTLAAMLRRVRRSEPAAPKAEPAPAGRRQLLAAKHGRHFARATVREPWTAERVNALLQRVAR